MERHNPPRSMLEGAQAFEIATLNDLPGECDSFSERLLNFSEKRFSSDKKVSFFRINTLPKQLMLLLNCFPFCKQKPAYID